MKALRDWLRDNEKTREFLADEEGRAIPARVGDQMRDVILAMADVMEAVGELKKAEDARGMIDGACVDWDKLYDNLYKSEAAANSVIKEVTG